VCVLKGGGGDDTQGSTEEKCKKYQSYVYI